ncbi:hypothetical protein ElyMa_006945100 [Elysia marginata]|uniref:Uncharacterized protein n=1 Tax=Elysia marginata TaxID=1093978 RepID=A0AAV4JHQ5_9GAST|nr:hypothetical protein ElyMa_006945100 [Elysia marginata]
MFIVVVNCQELNQILNPKSVFLTDRGASGNSPCVSIGPFGFKDGPSYDSVAKCRRFVLLDIQSLGNQLPRPTVFRNITTHMESH